MLRLLFVFGIVALGAAYSLKGPFYVLLFYLWNAYFRPESWVWSDLLWSLRLSLTIGIFLLVASIPRLQQFRLTRQTGLILLFLVQATIATLASEHSALAMPFYIEFVKIVIVTLLITILVDSEDRYRMTLAVIAFSLGFEAAKQGWAQLILNPGATNTNEHLMLGDNNGVAMGMMMLIPIFMALAETSRTRVERLTHRFFIGGVIYRGVSTYSRGGFLAGSLVALVSLWRAKHRIRTLIIVAIVAVGVTAVMPERFWDRMQTITAASDERDASAASRIYFWGLATQMAADRPLTGVGFNSFRYSFNRYNTMPEYANTIRTVHSSWFGVLSELGYPGFILFVALIGGSLLSCQRLKKQATLKGRLNLAIYATHLQTSLMVFVVGGSFLSAQYLELVWHLLALVAALERIVANADPSVDQRQPAVVPTVRAQAIIPRFRPDPRRRAAVSGSEASRHRSP